MVTKLAADEFQIVCFNLNWYNSSYFINAENQATVAEAKAYFDQTNTKKKIVIKLSGVSENSGYYVKRRSVNSNQGSIIDEWGKFDNDEKLERTEIKYLQEMCVPQLSRTKVQSKGHMLTLELELEPQEFCMLHVLPEY